MIKKKTEIDSKQGELLTANATSKSIIQGAKSLLEKALATLNTEKTKLEASLKSEKKLKESNFEKLKKNCDALIKNLQDFQNELESNYIDLYKNKMGSIFSSMNNEFKLLIQFNESINKFNRQNDNIKNNKLSNPFYNGIEKDSIKILIDKLLKVEESKNNNNGKRRYKLIIDKSGEGLRKLLKQVKTYYDEKAQFYQNRDSLISAFQLNKLISFKQEPQFTSEFNITNINMNTLFPTAKPSNKQTNKKSNTAISQSTQPQFGQPTNPAQKGGDNVKTNVKANNKNKPINKTEFIKVFDKIFYELRNKTASNPIYQNRISKFIQYIDDQDKKISELILKRLDEISKYKNIKYLFLMSSQLMFIIRRLVRIQKYLAKMNLKKEQVLASKNMNIDVYKNNYMTDIVLVYFSYQYILYNFLLCVQSEKSLTH